MLQKKIQYLKYLQLCYRKLQYFEKYVFTVTILLNKWGKKENKLTVV